MNTKTPTPALPPGVTLTPGQGGLPKLSIASALSTAEIYLQGAHVTAFRRHGTEPLLFLSGNARFAPQTPIRGGMPIIYPWFGPRPELGGQHGIARKRVWEVRGVELLPEGVVRVRFALPDCAESAGCPACALEYSVTVGEALTAELTVTNLSTRDFSCETCLHTYFAVGDVRAIAIEGLQGVEYLDQTAGFARAREQHAAINVAGEVDRIYLNAPARLTLRDPVLRRAIHIDTSGAASTVVWNPWILKSRSFADLGPDDYLRMVCIESGNVAGNRLTLAPGRAATLGVRYRVAPQPGP